MGGGQRDGLPHRPLGNHLCSPNSSLWGLVQVEVAPVGVEGRVIVPRGVSVCLRNDILQCLDPQPVAESMSFHYRHGSKEGSSGWRVGGLLPCPVASAVAGPLRCPPPAAGPIPRRTSSSRPGPLRRQAGPRIVTNRTSKSGALYRFPPSQAGGEREKTWPKVVKTGP